MNALDLPQKINVMTSVSMSRRYELKEFISTFLIRRRDQK